MTQSPQDWKVWVAGFRGVDIGASGFLERSAFWFRVFIQVLGGGR